jgi:hypothetical protein
VFHRLRLPMGTRRMLVAGDRVRKFWNGLLARRIGTAMGHLMTISVARVFIATENLAPRNQLKLRKHLR